MINNTAMTKLPPKLISALLAFFTSVHYLHAEDDTPTPQALKEKATILLGATNKLARDYRNASNGKNWGRSPGHKALYQSIFAYRDELETVTEMCKPGQSPDRLLTIAMDCKLRGKAMVEHAGFLILPDKILKQIREISERSKELISPIRQYEQRYFTWKKVDLQKKHGDDLAQFQRELIALQTRQNKIIQRASEIAREAASRPAQVIIIKPTHKNTDHSSSKNLPPKHSNR